MFGRSGQMFPRRAYHDAIYEPEYGSEPEEDCCRGRGLAGVLCWFLSVIILIGLAASVILTVFFVLKSRNLMGTPATTGSAGDDLDLLYGYGSPTSQSIKPSIHTIYEGTGGGNDYRGSTAAGGYHTPETPIFLSTMTSTRTSFDFVSTQKPTTRPTTVATTVTSRPRRTTTTTVPPTTRIITTRTTTTTTQPTTTTTTEKITERPSSTTTTTEQSMFNFFLDTIGNYNNRPNSREPISREDATIRDDILSNESSNRREEYSAAQPTTTSRSVSGMRSSAEAAHVLFSMPPSIQTSTTASMRRRPTRYPLLKSYSSSSLTENSEQKLEYASSERSVNKRQQEIEPSSTSTSTTISRTRASSASTGSTTSRTRASSTSTGTSTSRTRTSGASSPTSEASAPVPVSVEPEEPSSTPTTTTSTTSSSAAFLKHREDLLARIIKNLAPKFRNKTEVFSSLERETPNRGNLRIKTKVRKPTSTTTDPTPNVHSSIAPTSAEIEFKRSGQRGVNQPIEIVEGPNFASGNIPSTTDNQFLDILVGSEDHKTLFTKETDAGIITSAILPPWYVNETSGNETSTSDAVEGYLNPAPPLDDEHMNSSASSHHPVQSMGQLFMNFFSKDDENAPGPKFSNTQVSPGLRLRPKETQRPSFKDLLKDLAPVVFPSSSSAPALLPSMFNYADGNGYGYYPDDPIADDPPPAESQPADQSPPLRFEDETGADEMENSPSHIIDIAYDPKTRPEIVIEPDAPADYSYGDYLHDREQLSAGSETHPQVVAPPSRTTQAVFTGGTGSGLRRPMTTPEQQQIEEQPLPEQTRETETQDTRDTDAQQDIQIIAPALAAQSNEATKNDANESIQDDTQIAPAQNPSEPNAAEEDDNYYASRDSSREEIKRASNERAQYEEYEPDAPPMSSGQNIFVERQPVSQLDRTLYRQSQLPSPSPATTFPKRVRSNTTTEPPTTQKVHPVYAESITTPATTTTAVTVGATGSGEGHNSTGFVAPELINFHSNVYNFRPSVSSGGFLPASVESWRPVVYGSDEGSPNHRQHQPGPGSGQFRDPRPIPGPNQPIFQYTSAPTTSNSPPDYDQDQSVEEANQVRQDGGKPGWTTGNSNVPLNNHVPIKPSQPIPAPPSAVFPHQTQNRVKFPYPDPDTSASVSSSGIDRSKYLYRPAPPPIVMRRTPQQSMPYLPNRRKTPAAYPRVPPHYLNQQQQIQQQQMLKERLFQQNLARMRKRGNVQWPDNTDPRLRHYPHPQPPSRRQG